MRHESARTIASLALACTLGVANVASAAEPERYTIDARIDAEQGTIDATIAIDVRLADQEDRIALWLYADRLAVPPSAMEERSWRWIYPGEIDRGEMTLSDVRVDGEVASIDEAREPEGTLRGRDFAGSDTFVHVTPGVERTVHVTLTMHLHVPDRFGRLGRDGWTFSLAAPWYPLVVDGDAWDFAVPHALHAVTSRGELRTRTARGREIEIEDEVAYVPAMIATPPHERSIEVRPGHRLVYVTSDPIYTPPPASAPGLAGLRDLVGIDRVRLIAEAYGDVIDTATWLGIALPEELVVMAVHSRTELAASAPGVALVSDRIFEILPLDVVQEFHRRAVRRALFATIVQPMSAGEPAVDRGWITDLRGAALVDLDEARRNNATQTPQQLLSLFAFHPAVDQLLYAPQISFEATYFGAIDEPDRFRDDPVRARFPVTRGRRLLECVRDVLDDTTSSGAEAMERFMAMLARGHRDVRSALTRAGVDVDERLDGWLRYTSLAVNYRLGEITPSERPTERTERRSSSCATAMSDPSP